MVVLALETVTPGGSLALARAAGEPPVVSRRGESGVPLAVWLPSAITQFLTAHGLTLDEVTRLAVVSGPGSFTGVRIGVACAQGFAVTRGWQVAAVPSLDAIADGWRHAHGGATPRTVLACLDGMRGEVFTAAYRWDGTAMQPLGDPRVGPPSPDALDALEAPVSVVGSGGVRYAEVWTGRAEILDAAEPLAAGAARLAASADWALVSPHALRPVYVRRPDVELARDRARQA